ncbi:tRNA (adenosine(37)-N6)-threonylcarbamoyltransferase complex dimerization subunit type 1 TsaB [Candidatus Saccharibacteria bacterium]|nr:tRNA (adenosine(37)-N6)-threonylcarbamoyltransferase complex dimerization subunit type 1 TsaB [Candidatus Saccharibacteria bacterium]
MIILSVKTDQPVAEIEVYENTSKIDGISWEAHRQLADTIHKKILELIQRNNLEINNVSGVICFKGPGSFTGLRIGASIVNALGYSLNIPVVGMMGNNWQVNGAKSLLAGENHKTIIPEYGGEANITLPKK